MVTASVIVPTYKGSLFITHLLESLGRQSFDDFEVVIVVKPSGDGTENIVREKCQVLDLQYSVLLQNEGYFTHALNMGMRNSNGQILLFTDDDAILPRNWIERHIKAHSRFRSVGAMSGNILNYDLESRKVLPLETSMPMVRIYRRFFRSIIERPHVLFRHYKSGVYVTKDYRVVAGSGIPCELCLSLPLRGVNMSLRTQSVEDVRFPEHPLLKRCPFNEPYIGAQIVMKGWDALYDPNICVYHIIRESLSRNKNKRESLVEQNLMRSLFKILLQENRV